jgi:hypothetical protein
VVQPTDARRGGQGRGSRGPEFNRTSTRSGLAEHEVCSVPVVLRHELAHLASEMAVVHDMVWSSSLRRSVPTNRSATPSCQGLRKTVLVGLTAEGGPGRLDPYGSEHRDDVGGEGWVAIEDEVVLSEKSIRQKRLEQHVTDVMHRDSEEPKWQAP